MSVIYQYVCNDDAITDSYIGSTGDLRQREFAHKTKSFTKPTPFHKFVLEHGGWENWVCVILAEIEEGIEKEERLRLEQAFIRQLNPSLNSKRAFRTEEERLQQVRGVTKKWREKNQDYFKARAKKVIECSCGKTYTLPNKAPHFKTKFHIENSIANEQS